jgi:transposase
MHYQFDDKTRFLVIYQDVTKTVRSIAKYTKISESTIRFWIEKLNQGIDIMEIQEGRGRKRNLTEEDLDCIEEEVKADPYAASSRQLASEFGVSQKAMLAALHELEFEYKSVKPIPQLTQEHKRLRLQFCEKILKDPTQLNRIWFSDEMGCNLRMCKKKVWTQGEIYYHETPKSQRLNVWASISSIGKTSFELYRENLAATLYNQILEDHFYEMDRVNWRRWAFQQDNLPLHTSPCVMAWFDEKAISVLDWPPYSPDFNPIENLWGWLKGEVVKDNPETIDDLEESLIENWERITVDFLQGFIDSLYDRILLCIEMGGERTDK